MVKQQLIPAERIERSILLIRGQKVMLDSDLAELYGVETRALIQAVKRNQRRFPVDFTFQLTLAETESLRSQIVISKKGRGGRRTLPYRQRCTASDPIGGRVVRPRSRACIAGWPFARSARSSIGRSRRTRTARWTGRAQHQMSDDLLAHRFARAIRDAALTCVPRFGPFTCQMPRRVIRLVQLAVGRLSLATSFDKKVAGAIRLR